MVLVIYIKLVYNILDATANANTQHYSVTACPNYHDHKDCFLVVPQKGPCRYGCLRSDMDATSWLNCNILRISL